MDLINFLRELKKRKEELLWLESYEDIQIEDELAYLIELLEKKIIKLFSEQPKLNRYVLYLYYIKNISYEEQSELFGLEEEDFFQIMTDFDESY